jgi:hypothetical protein
LPPFFLKALPLTVFGEPRNFGFSFGRARRQL